MNELRQVDRSGSNAAPASTTSGEGRDFGHLKTRRSAAAVRGTIWSGVNAIVPTLVTSLVFVVSSRYLTPTEFGLVALAGSIGMFASAVAPGALGEALIQRSQIDERHLDTVFWLCLGVAGLLYAILTLSAGRIAAHVEHPELNVLLPVMGARVIFDLAAVVPNALIARSMRFHLIALRTTVASLMAAVLCVGLLVAGYGIWALAVSQLSVAVVTCVVAFWGAGWRPGRAIRAVAIRDLGRYGLFASGNRFLYLMNLDQIIIGIVAGPASLGIYNFARRLYAMVSDLIAGALSVVSHALMSSLQGEREKLREAFMLATFASASAAFPAFVGLGAIAQDAVPLIFGPVWLDAVMPIRAFCLIGLLASIGVIQAALVTSQGRSDWWFYYQAAQQALNVAIVVTLADQPITVIVLAIALKTLLLWPVSVRMTARILDLDVRRYAAQFAVPAVASLAMLAAVLAVGAGMADDDAVLRLLAEVAVGAIVYTLVAGVLARRRLKTLIAIVRRR